MGYQHHWSGWPGAFCLHCYIDDPVEQAIADGIYDPYTGEFSSPEERDKVIEALKCPILFSADCPQCTVSPRPLSAIPRNRALLAIKIEPTS